MAEPQRPPTTDAIPKLRGVERIGAALMSNKTNTELLPIIRDIEATTRCLRSVTALLRRMAARPWPEIPNGEGIAAPLIVGIIPAGSICDCGHAEVEHQSPVGGMAWCRECRCNRYTPTQTDPRD